MTATEVIEQLQKAIREHGDLPCVTDDGTIEAVRFYEDENKQFAIR